MKRKISMKFKSLKEVLENPLSDMIDCDMDYTNMFRLNQLKVVLISVWQYVSKFGKPQFYEDECKFMEIFKNQLEQEVNKFDNKEEMKEEMVKILETNVP